MGTGHVTAEPMNGRGLVRAVGALPGTFTARPAGAAADGR
ncbi:hypothetical protein STBA_52430 [Streptomyces sp. MP131-18]|nr:hypothetical protein STBA_52430 [Streptomyces sp. MP131-18]